MTPSSGMPWRSQRRARLGELLGRHRLGVAPPPCTRQVLVTMSVPMWPGMTTATFTCGALTRKSVTSASENPFTANFAVLYAVCGMPGPRQAQKPFTLLVLTR